MSREDYKTMLVPYDGSVFSRRALDVAKDLAKSFGAVLQIVTVIDVSRVPPPGIIRSGERKALEKIVDSTRQSVREAMEKIESECLREGIKTRILVAEGSTSAELLKAIKESKADLVIIGSGGLSGLSKFKALGSVSRKISEISDCPVMIIR